jgi:hypothetical protein
LWIIWVFLGILGIVVIAFGTFAFTLKKHKKE